MQIPVIIFMLTNVANVFQMQNVINITINKGNNNLINKEIKPIDKVINKIKISNRHFNNSTQRLVS